MPFEPPPAMTLATSRMLLRPAVPALALAWRDYRLRNDRRFAPTDPPRTADFHALERVERVLVSMQEGRAAGTQVAYAIVAHDAPEVVIGTCRFSQIVRGPFQSCMLGYGIDGAYEGRGYMTEALRAAIDDMFDRHRLHRVQANHLPENARSAAVLKRLGFVREGMAPSYLRIAGAWRDHVLNALINPRYDDAWLADFP